MKTYLGILIQPIDRYYNRHCKQREDRIEILSDKYANTIICSGSTVNNVLEIKIKNNNK